MYKLIIFDLDGTLLNTSYDIQKVLNETLTHYNFPALTLEKTMKCVGNGAKKLIERALPCGNEQLFEEVYARYAKAFAECDNSLTFLYDGEEEFLKRLKTNQIKTAIVTNKPQDATDKVYVDLLSRFDFDVVIGQSDKFALKPDPQSTLSVIETLKMKKSDCLFVGDGETDVQTALNAGISCVSALWGYRTREQLNTAGAKMFASSYSQLEEIVFNN